MPIAIPKVFGEFIKCNEFDILLTSYKRESDQGDVGEGAYIDFVVSSVQFHHRVMHIIGDIDC